MCGDKAQRVLMAIVLGFIAYLMYSGETLVAMVLQSFVIVMLLIFAFTNFCPSLWFFDKVFGKCNWNKKEENQ